MSEKLFTALPYSHKTIEISSLLDQIDKQYITAGQYLQNQLIREAHESGKELTKREYMAAQRGFSWEKWRSSNLIVSTMMQGFVPAIMLYRGDSTSQFKKTMDGQQRQTTWWLFVYNKFPLDMSKANFNRFVVNGIEYSVKKDLHGKYFSDLPQEWQDSILTYPVEVIIYSNCSDKEAEDLYVRMNRGTKSLSAIEIRVAAMGATVRSFIYSFLNGSWTLHAMTSAAANGTRGLDIVTQILALTQHSKGMELSKDNIDDVMYTFRDFGIPEDVQINIPKTQEFLNQVTNSWTENKKTVDSTKTTGRKVKNYNLYRYPFLSNKTISLMLVWSAYRAVQEDVDVNKFQEWAFDFFQNPSEDFKKGMPTSANKSGDLTNVQLRLQAIENELEKLKGKSIDSTVQENQDDSDESNDAEPKD